jgi:predicted site-specific integrase-resolvase
MASSTKTYRPEQVASALGISGKIVRAYLRKTFPRPANAKGTTWVLDAKQAGATMKHFKSLNPASTESKSDG